MRQRTFTIEWSNNAAKQFQAIKDQKRRERILEVIEQEIAVNPLIGKPLTEPFKGVRSYRVGKLMVLYKPYKERLTIVVLRVEHRKSVYRG